MDNATLISLRLAREGFWSGDPGQVFSAPTDQVLDAWEFVTFQDEYAETLTELNKPIP